MIAGGDMLCSPQTEVGEKTYQARMRRTALSIYRNSHEHTIIQQWKSTKFIKNGGGKVSYNQLRRAEASQQRTARRSGNRITATERR